MERIPNGTEFVYDHEPSERWRVESFVRDDADEDGDYEVYRCRIIDGDTGQYSTDRNEDGTVDLVGDSIQDALATVDGGDDAPDGRTETR